MNNFSKNAPVIPSRPGHLIPQFPFVETVITSVECDEPSAPINTDMKAVPNSVFALIFGLVIGVLACLFALKFLTEETPPVERPAEPSIENHSQRPAPPVPALAALFPSAPETPRDFRSPNEADQAAWDTLEKAFWSAQDETQRLELLDQIESQFYTRLALPLLKKILESPEEVIGSLVRDRALDLLSGNTSPEILPLLQTAARQGDEDFRARAILACAQVRSPEVIDFLSSAFLDPHSLVRLSAFDAVDHQSAEIRHRLYEKALMATHADAAVHALGELQVSASHASVPVLITGLNAPLAEVREEAAAALEFLFDTSFTNASEAALWWQNNQKNYNRDLMQKD